MPLFMGDFGPQIILDKVLQLFSLLLQLFSLYSLEYPYVPNCKVVVKTSLWWEWDLGGRSANSFFLWQGFFSLEESAVPDIVRVVL